MLTVQASAPGYGLERTRSAAPCVLRCRTHGAVKVAGDDSEGAGDEGWRKGILGRTD